MFLFARGDVTRAHHVLAVRLAAAADTDAPGDGVSKVTAVVRIGECNSRALERLRKLQIGIERIRPDDLARIHLPIRIPDRLELTKGLDELVAVHAR